MVEEKEKVDDEEAQNEKKRVFGGGAGRGMRKR